MNNMIALLLTDRTPEEKRVMCAEACGWTPYVGDSFNCPAWINEVIDRTGYYFIHDLPAYDTSLDAMAEAETRLLWNESDIYLDALARIVSPAHGYRFELTIGVVSATAAQRLDAFLIAKGLCE